MFIKINEFVINTDNITYTELLANSMTVIHFLNKEDEIRLEPEEAAKLWAELNVIDTTTY